MNHTGTMMRSVEALHEMGPDGVVEIDPEDAAALLCAVKVPRAV